VEELHRESTGTDIVRLGYIITTAYAKVKIKSNKKLGPIHQLYFPSPKEKGNVFTLLVCL